jgi:tyrosine-protein phosphatase YwqE
MDETIEMILAFQKAGFRKLVTTPHVIHGSYDNTPEVVRARLKQVHNELTARNIDMKLEAAAEYMFDENFVRWVQDGDELLTFGSSKYLLFETTFTAEPMQMKEIIVTLQRKDYFPVLAHPDRYQYLHNDWNKVKKIFETGVLFQINVMSLSGYYGKAHQALAEKLIDNEMVHFLGSDCHRMKHQQEYELAMKSKYYRRALDMQLHNHYV